MRCNGQGGISAGKYGIVLLVTPRALALKNARDTFKEALEKFVRRTDRLFLLQERAAWGGRFNEAFAQAFKALESCRVDSEQRVRTFIDNGLQQTTVSDMASLRGLLQLVKTAESISLKSFIEDGGYDTFTFLSLSTPLKVRPQIAPNAPAL